MNVDKYEFKIEDCCHFTLNQNDESTNTELSLSKHIKKENITSHNDDDNFPSFNIINLDESTDNKNFEIKSEDDSTLNNLKTSFKVESEDNYKDLKLGNTNFNDEHPDNLFLLELEYKNKIIKVEKEIFENNIFESEIEVDKYNFLPVSTEKNIDTVNSSELAGSTKSTFDEQVDCRNTNRDKRKLKRLLFICNWCHKSFHSKKTLITHINNFSINCATNSISKYVCLKTNNLYKQLINISLKKKIFECNICKSHFSDQSNCIRHAKTHFCTNEKKLKCEICSKTFSREYNLKVHRKIHTGESPYKCDLCPSSFYRKDLLQGHRRKHEKSNKEKKYSIVRCNQCSKQFYSNSTLKRHEKIHGNENPYMCNYCHQTFSRKDYLVVHFRSKHTGERPYHCDICSKSFFENNVLIRHKKLHRTVKNTKV